MYSVLHREFRMTAETADDLYQEVFLRLWDDDYRRLRLWRGDGDFVGYLGPIVRNLALEHFRRVGRDVAAHAPPDPPPGTERDDPAGEEPSPEELAAVDERRRAVESEVERLDARKRELYRRRFVEGQKHREIAAAMGMTVPHVGVALLRLERQLTDLVRETIDNGRLPARGRTGVRSDPPEASLE